ncbi:MAG: polymer-forming cytoskeletal protein [Candidatus Cyclonatronum sp.]|uniref:bactofilin family protein n=1 Tax=Cyclonatronum sp. TaxID=3024185 RepID=UPI0025B99274|nr:polymer-forming cytoskeletal protein [Cyclonatronum sp.]MCC5932765.1 polymer-forming cytoskeletal protein [Balneolales bacterium]MCH8486130.1 polymer-forming cytoskeletal protein [Cyclonatronum sp.]
MLKNKPKPEEKEFSDFENVCMLGRNSLIKDNRLIAFANSKISGALMLDIYCQQNLVISEGAVVIGNIFADSVHVYGKVAGNIQASEKVHIHENAQICGTVQCKIIKIDEGAFCKIDGSVGSTDKLSEPYRTANDSFYTDNISYINSLFEEQLNRESESSAPSESQKKKAARFRLKTEEKATTPPDTTETSEKGKRGNNSLLF